MGNCLREKEEQGFHSQSRVQHIFNATAKNRRIIPDVKPNSNQQLGQSQSIQEKQADSSLELPQSLGLHSKTQSQIDQKHTSVSNVPTHPRRCQQIQKDSNSPSSIANLIHVSNNLQNQSLSEGDCKFTLAEGICKEQQSHRVENSRTQSQSARSGYWPNNVLIPEQGQLQRGFSSPKQRKNK